MLTFLTQNRDYNLQQKDRRLPRRFFRILHDVCEEFCNLCQRFSLKFMN